MQSVTNTVLNLNWQNNGMLSDSFFVKMGSCSAFAKILPQGSDSVAVVVNAFSRLYDFELGEEKHIEKTSIVHLDRNKTLSEYFYCSDNTGSDLFQTGDTIWGSYHTNDVISTSGAPVFYGKMTAGMGISPDPLDEENDAEYHDGYEIGITVNLPTNMSYLVNEAVTENAGAPANSKTIYDVETTFELLPNGDIFRTVSGLPTDTVSLIDIASSGVIYSTANVNVHGTLNGRVTFYTTNSIYIENDVIYANSPLVDINSDDILGLVADNDVIIRDNAANNDGVTIFACIYAVNGSFISENYDTRPQADMYFVGSIAENNAGYHGDDDDGFVRKMIYDPRLQVGNIEAPHFPLLNTLSIISFWE
jgi:hypothetical protein